MASSGSEVLSVSSETGHRQVQRLLGKYVRNGSSFGRPVYCKQNPFVEEEVYLYFWDSRGRRPGVTGWFFGEEINSASVWALNETDEALPPETGWQVRGVIRAEEEGALLVRPTAKVRLTVSDAKTPQSCEKGHINKFISRFLCYKGSSCGKCGNLVPVGGRLRRCSLCLPVEWLCEGCEVITTGFSGAPREGPHRNAGTCFRWLKRGFCSDGEKCKFWHPPPEEKMAELLNKVEKTDELYEASADAANSELDNRVERTEPFGDEASSLLPPGSSYGIDAVGKAEYYSSGMETEFQRHDEVNGLPEHDQGFEESAYQNGGQHYGEPHQIDESANSVHVEGGDAQPEYYHGVDEPSTQACMLDARRFPASGALRFRKQQEHVAAVKHASAGSGRATRTGGYTFTGSPRSEAGQTNAPCGDESQDDPGPESLACSDGIESGQSATDSGLDVGGKANGISARAAEVSAQIQASAVTKIRAAMDRLRNCHDPVSYSMAATELTMMCNKRWSRIYSDREQLAADVQLSLQEVGAAVGSRFEWKPPMTAQAARALKRGREETCLRQEHAAALKVRKVVQQMRTANSETWPEAYATLAEVFASMAPQLGSQRAAVEAQAKNAIQAVNEKFEVSLVCPFDSE
eukprot:TRINITY_DN19757_c0_g1_i5.p1 TRINITY_DN19757_c0_g1~~TRINITY_DN19757_c0_g1_i5.p1  ORF type:complete len:634 (+),score=104.83 TRINITY_DN19757_c0_g1_i5:12-1913(+)